MAKSAQSILYGVRGFKENLKFVSCHDWAHLRANTRDNADLTGVISTPEGDIIWFADPGARHDFQQTFGGVNVTLSRKTDTATGVTAQKLLRQMQLDQENRGNK